MNDYTAFAPERSVNDIITSARRGTRRLQEQTAALRDLGASAIAGPLDDTLTALVQDVATLCDLTIGHEQAEQRACELADEVLLAQRIAVTGKDERPGLYPPEKYPPLAQLVRELWVGRERLRGDATSWKEAHAERRAKYDRLTLALERAAERRERLTLAKRDALIAEANGGEA